MDPQLSRLEVMTKGCQIALICTRANVDLLQNCVDFNVSDSSYFRLESYPQKMLWATRPAIVEEPCNGVGKYFLCMSIR